ncbi:MAG: hypothetical protein NVS9B7_02850 [Flavisolibacter sp.]
MVQAYNFIGSWQLFPEKGSYEKGERPKSGIYKIENGEADKEIIISQSWISLENQGYTSTYKVRADGGLHNFENKSLADEVEMSFVDSINFELRFYRSGRAIFHILHELLPNGYLKITQQGSSEPFTHTNVEIYHRQISVLPYSSSVSGALIRPTEQGVIRHKALTAMEEQTNMQLDQIRKQIELLALEAQEIHKRKELSRLIYKAKLSFAPVIGQLYYLYETNEGNYTISLISPKEWGPSVPYKKFVAPVQLLADHTWKEI